MILDEVTVLSKPITVRGHRCIHCGQLIDTKTTTTMLCKQCKKLYVKEKAQRTCQERYHVSNPSQIPGMGDKIKKRMLEKYGAECAMNVPESRMKFEHTMQERYGVKYFVNSDQYTGNASCKSKVNHEFAKFMSQYNVVFSEEFVVDSKRFDFKLASTSEKILIEVDPSYTHNAAGNHWEREGSDSNKQLIKTLIAEKHRYRCIHVFDWDSWNSILDLILPKQSVYARQCTVSRLSYEDALQFISRNSMHKIKGDSCSTYWGLTLNDMLLQVMSLSKDKTYGYQYELTDLCSLATTRIIGGASKLFNHALRQIGSSSIVATCDRSKFNGNVFAKLGMKLIKEVSPCIHWSKGSRCQSDTPASSTSLLTDGWLPVFDCGQLVFALGVPTAESSVDDSQIDYAENYAELLQSIDKSKEKICAFCNLPFVPNSNQQKYCKRPHYMKCPVCGKDYLVTNNENLKQPPVACSYACRKVRREKTSLDRYGIKAPGNNPQARMKAKSTMQERYGVDYAMQSEEVKRKSIDSMRQRYGVDNIAKIRYVSKDAHEAAATNWKQKVHSLLPLKLVDATDKLPPKIGLDDNQLSIFLLTEKASTTFLSKYGFNIVHKFGKIHMSVGLVNDGVLYQVLRFEKVPNSQTIKLADFGTREGYFNPNYYSKLIQFATEVKGIEDFVAEIPRQVASEQLVSSLSLQLVSEGDYEVYWVIEHQNKHLSLPPEFQKLTNRDNIQEMLKSHDYITSDYLDKYKYVADYNKPTSNIQEYFSNEFLGLKYD